MQYIQRHPPRRINVLEESARFKRDSGLRVSRRDIRVLDTGLCRGEPVRGSRADSEDVSLLGGDSRTACILIK